MQTITNPQELFTEADKRATEKAIAYGDNGYGCGSSFVTIKGNTAFYRTMKKLGKTSRDAYYGMILETDKRQFNATLTQEAYNEEFARVLRENGVHAFNHTYLT